MWTTLFAAIGLFTVLLGLGITVLGLAIMYLDYRRGMFVEDHIYGVETTNGT